MNRSEDQVSELKYHSCSDNDHLVDQQSEVWQHRMDYELELIQQMQNLTMKTPHSSANPSTSSSRQSHGASSPKQRLKNDDSKTTYLHGDKEGSWEAPRLADSVIPESMQENDCYAERNAYLKQVIFGLFGPEAKPLIDKKRSQEASQPVNKPNPESRPGKDISSKPESDLSKKFYKGMHVNASFEKLENPKTHNPKAKPLDNKERFREASGPAAKSIPKISSATNPSYLFHSRMADLEAQAKSRPQALCVEHSQIPDQNYKYSNEEYARLRIMHYRLTVLVESAEDELTADIKIKDGFATPTIKRRHELRAEKLELMAAFKEHAQLEHQVKNMSSEIASHKRKMIEKDGELKEQGIQFGINLGIKEAENSALKFESSQLSQHNSRLQQEKGIIEAQNSEIAQLNKGLSEKTSALERSLEEQELQTKKEGQRRANIEGQLNKVHHKSQQLESVRAELNKKVTDLTIVSSQLLLDKQGLEARLDDVQSVQAELQKKVTELTTVNSQLLLDKKGLEAKLDDIRKDPYEQSLQALAEKGDSYRKMAFDKLAR